MVCVDKYTDIGPMTIGIPTEIVVIQSEEEFSNSSNVDSSFIRCDLD